MFAYTHIHRHTRTQTRSHTCPQTHGNGPTETLSCQYSSLTLGWDFECVCLDLFIVSCFGKATRFKSANYLQECVCVCLCAHTCVCMSQVLNACVTVCVKLQNIAAQ